MSQFTNDYDAFFTSPAGISILTWLQEQRISEHDKAEDNPEYARDHTQVAKGYKEILQHIDSVRTPLRTESRSSNGADV